VSRFVIRPVIRPHLPLAHDGGVAKLCVGWTSSPPFVEAK
jgi:hypothetical protein